MYHEYHDPVLLREVLEHLQVKSGGKYIDCTLGDGGHTTEILRGGGMVLGIDGNKEAINRAVGRLELSGLSEHFTGVLGNFKNIDSLADAHGFDPVDGILMDLGYSSFELEEGGTGISFLKDDPLDMRFLEGYGVPASEIVNNFPERDLAEIFFKYGGERLARKYAKEIVKARGLKKFQTAKQLADFLAGVASPGYERGRIHPATRVFQALRIVVNDELNNLEVSLPRAARLLVPGGKLIVISFHSLEDKLVKDFGRGAQPTLLKITNKPVTPSEEEIARNPRSRSAKMRVFEKQANK